MKKNSGYILSEKGRLWNSIYKIILFKKSIQDFPGGVVDKNLSANLGDMHLIPGLGRLHMV